MVVVAAQLLIFIVFFFAVYLSLNGIFLFWKWHLLQPTLVILHRRHTSFEQVGMLSKLKRNGALLWCVVLQLYLLEMYEQRYEQGKVWTEEMCKAKLYDIKHNLVYLFCHGIETSFLSGTCTWHYKTNVFICVLMNIRVCVCVCVWYTHICIIYVF